MDNEALYSEMMAVKDLGERIGYGNLMCWASALWRKHLARGGNPVNGAFVPRCVRELGPSEALYDGYLRRATDGKDV